MKDQNSNPPVIAKRRPGRVKAGLVPTLQTLFYTLVFHRMPG